MRLVIKRNSIFQKINESCEIVLRFECSNIFFLSKLLTHGTNNLLNIVNFLSQSVSGIR